MVSANFASRRTFNFLQRKDNCKRWANSLVYINVKLILWGVYLREGIVLVVFLPYKTCEAFKEK